MGLETGTYIDELVASNPISSDPRSEGDDHLRLIKTLLKNTFPNMAGAFARVQAKSAAYTVVAADNTSVIRCMAALSLYLPTAAAVGNRHMFFIWANGGPVTLYPSGGATINGAATQVVENGGWAIVFCNGAEFGALVLPVTLPANLIVNTPAGSISSTTVQSALNELDGDITALDAAVPRKNGAGAAGTWGINVSGSAASATTANSATTAGSCTGNAATASASAVTTTTGDTVLDSIGLAETPPVYQGNYLDAAVWRIRTTGVYRVKGSAVEYARTYVNGTAYGAVHLSTSFTDDVFVQAGDLLQLQAAVYYGAGPAKVNDISIGIGTPTGWSLFLEPLRVLPLRIPNPPTPPV